MLKSYLIVSSVIFHVALLASLFWLVPFFSNAAEIGAAQVDSFQDPEVGVIEDVSVLTRNDVPYKGYKINLQGQHVYVTGNSDKTYRVGDEVDLTISQHPYMPLNTLMISIIGVSR